MAARVDAAAMQVTDGDVRFPFTASCATGTAALQSGERTIAIRVLNWDETCAIARFSGLGGDFVARQMLQACSAPPPGRVEREAALALAMWLHAPDEPPLPMDARLLARVTLDLCRSLAIEPEALGHRAAPEVQALWRALQENGAEAPRGFDDPDVTRIVVLPDSARSEFAFVSGASEQETVATTAFPGTRIRVATASQSADAPHPAQEAVPLRIADDAAHPAAPTLTSSKELPHALDIASPIADAERPQALPSAAVMSAPRFRLQLDVLAQDTRNPPAPGELMKVPGDRLSAASQPLPAPDHSPSPMRPTSAPPAARNSGKRLDPTPLPVDRLIAPATAPDIASARHDALARVVAAVVRPHETPTTSPTESPDLLDRFAHDLETAAAELGIAVVA